MKRYRSLLIISPVIIFLLYFFYYPLGYILVLTMSNSISDWIALFNHPLFLRFLFFTISQSLVTLLLSTVIGVYCGYLMARYRPYYLSSIRVFITVPFIFPPLALLMGVIILFGPQGRLSAFGFSFNPFSYWGIVFLHVIYNISVMARITESAFMNEPHELHVIAETLGAGPWKRFKTVTLPHIKPQVEAAMMLVFLYAFNSFAITLVLGEVRLQTIEVMIYSQSRVSQNYQSSSMLVIFQLLINLVVILFYSKRKYSSPIISESIPTRPTNRIPVTILLTTVILIVWSPVIILVNKLFSYTESDLTDIASKLLSSDFDRFLGTSPLRVIINTIFFGLMVSTLALIFAMLLVIYLSRAGENSQANRWITVVTLLPMATSAISLSFALSQTHGSQSNFTSLVWIYITSAQLIAALPFASRALISGWSRIPEDLLLVSNTLGASWLMNFERVVLPYLKSALLVTILFSFAISLGEFGATYYLSRGEWVTLSISIYKLLGGQNIAFPVIYSLILILTTVIVFYIIERVGKLELRI